MYEQSLCPRTLCLVLAAASSLGCQGYPPELPPIDPEAETVQCWVPGTELTFENCCYATKVNFLGSPMCWNKEFTYEVCCLPAIRHRIAHGFQIMESGSFRQASDFFFDLFANCFLGDEGAAARVVFPDLFKTLFAGYEKAAKEFRRELEEHPKELSYFDVLFSGMSISCPAKVQDGLHHQVASPYDDWVRCCHQQGLDHNMNCFHIFEMMANALGRSRRAAFAEDAYYEDFSEHWAFHHFTPSMLGTSDGPDATSAVRKAYEEDPEVAAALESAGCPSLGIVWGNFVNYRTPQFEYGVYFVTSLVSRLRAEGAASSIDMLEIGAGYGTTPRMLASARTRLNVLEKDPVKIESYTILDVRSVIDLQRWYLGRTVGELVDQRDWTTHSIGDYFAAGLQKLTDTIGAASLWPFVDDDIARPQEMAILPINFVDPSRRETFVNLFGRGQGVTQKRRPVRVLLAINSWHEFPMEEYLWYYNAFVVAPPSLSGVDWIVYVSNREWDENAVKESLLLEPHPSFRFERALEECSVQTCFRILRRAS